MSQSLGAWPATFCFGRNLHRRDKRWRRGLDLLNLLPYLRTRFPSLTPAGMTPGRTLCIDRESIVLGRIVVDAVVVLAGCVMVDDVFVSVDRVMLLEVVVLCIRPSVLYVLRQLSKRPWTTVSAPLAHNVTSAPLLRLRNTPLGEAVG